MTIGALRGNIPSATAAVPYCRAHASLAARRRDWREIMEREGVDLVLPCQTTWQQSAWLCTTRIPLRRLHFPTADATVGSALPRNTAERTAARLTAATDVLPTSLQSLEVAVITV